MVDKIRLFTKSAYIFWNNCGRDLDRVIKGLEGRELRFDMINQKANTGDLIRKYPNVFSIEDTYEIVGKKYPKKEEEHFFSIKIILKNTKTGETAELKPEWLAAFDIVGATLKEKISAKLTAVKKLLHK